MTFNDIFQRKEIRRMYSSLTLNAFINVVVCGCSRYASGRFWRRQRCDQMSSVP